MEKELAAFMDWFRTHTEHQNIVSSTLVNLWRKSDEYKIFLNIPNEKQQEREATIEEINKRLAQSQERVKDICSVMYNSLKELGKLHKEDALEKAIKGVKEFIDKIENKQ